jgi:hypothetical protein
MPMNGCVSSLNIASDYEVQRKPPMSTAATRASHLNSSTL